MKLNKRIYIGDGVYVMWDGYHLWLTANNPTTDRVALDHQVRAFLMRILKDVDKEDK
jgi:hypothetical protein